MTKVNFMTSDFRRDVAQAAPLLLRNRYFEANPSLTDDSAALLARPGLDFWMELPPGPIRGLHSEAGSFNGDVFVASGDTLYRVTADRQVTTIQGGLFEPEKGVVNMAITSNIDSVPEYLFVCDGRLLYVYDGTTCTQVTTPDDVGIIDVAVSSSHVIVIPVQGAGINGRFFWIEPGEKTIDPLNFATAESAPDAVYGVKVIGDQFFLPGESTCEVWYVSADTNARMQRLKGVAFDRGTWEATAQAIDEAVLICDVNGAVFLIQGGTPKRVSTPSIEEQIRKAIATQQYQTS